MSGNSEDAGAVKGILKKKESKNKNDPNYQDQQRVGTVDSGIQWDEMNILMTEHPADKDYGHMKIEEPKTPYHEMLPDDDEQGPSSSGTSEPQFFTPEDLALKVQQASTNPRSNWDKDESSEEDVTEEAKDHALQFSEWRKKHYNEFHAVKRAKELMKQDEEEMMEFERQEKGAGSMEDEDEGY